MSFWVPIWKSWVILHSIFLHYLMPLLLHDIISDPRCWIVINAVTARNFPVRIPFVFRFHTVSQSICWYTFLVIWTISGPATSVASLRCADLSFRQCLCCHKATTVALFSSGGGTNKIVLSIGSCTAEAIGSCGSGGLLDELGTPLKVSIMKIILNGMGSPSSTQWDPNHFELVCRSLVCLHAMKNRDPEMEVAASRTSRGEDDRQDVIAFLVTEASTSAGGNLERFHQEMERRCWSISNDRSNRRARILWRYVTDFFAIQVPAKIRPTVIRPGFSIPWVCLMLSGCSLVFFLSAHAHMRFPR